MCQNCISSKESNLANTPQKKQRVMPLMDAVVSIFPPYGAYMLHPCLCIEAPSVLFIILPMTSSAMMSLRDSREVSLKPVIWMDGWFKEAETAPRMFFDSLYEQLKNNLQLVLYLLFQFQLMT